MLPANADGEACREWLRQVCSNFGIGFHLDTSAADYLSEDGTPLSLEVASTFDDSIHRVFAVSSLVTHMHGAVDHKRSVDMTLPTQLLTA